MLFLVKFNPSPCHEVSHQAHPRLANMLHFLNQRPPPRLNGLRVAIDNHSAPYFTKRLTCTTQISLIHCLVNSNR